jgi:hypothetical protein
MGLAKGRNRSAIQFVISLGKPMAVAHAGARSAAKEKKRPSRPIVAARTFVKGIPMQDPSDATFSASAITQTSAFWQGLESNPLSRAEALEWLRLESLRLAEPRLTSEQREVHFHDLLTIKAGEHHALLFGGTPTTTPGCYDGSPLTNKRLSPIAVLKAGRFTVPGLTTGTIMERTLIEPHFDDPDPAKPGELLCVRLILSVDIDYSEPELIESFKRHVKAAKARAGRRRAPGGGRRSSIVQMWEAIRLYETNKPLKDIGWEAESFGSKDEDFVGNVDYYVNRGMKVRKLARQMIKIAKSEAVEWRKKFL